MRTILAVLVLLGLPLAAAERSGPYVGAGFGIATFFDDGFFVPAANRERGAWRLQGGAYINRHLSVELDYTLFESFEGEHPEYESVEETFGIFSVAALAHYPMLDDSVDLFGKFGAGEINWDESGGAERSSAAAAMLFGCGVGYRITPELMIKAGYDLYTFGLHETAETFDMRLNFGYAGLEVQF